VAFKILYSEEAFLLLQKMDNREVKQIVDKLDEAVANPAHYFSRLSGRAESKLRAGDYRVVVDMDFGAQTIFVRSLGHRKHIYKRLK